MTLRLNYATAAPEATKALRVVSTTLKQTGIDTKLLDLIYLRVSQINGCSYCVDLHSRDLRAAGESNERLDGLATWHESPFFTKPEKAMLAWAESLTNISVTRAPDAVFDEVRKLFSDQQLANLTYGIALMNAWNRIAVGFRQAPKGN